jgi:hypothetical protein
MELLEIKPASTNGTTKIIDELLFVPKQEKSTSTSSPFIQANTIETTLEEMKHKHIIPVFIKDNEPLISHTDFIEATAEVVNYFYSHEEILTPAIRVSHPILGRIPSAKDKPAKDLQENEKTVYFERMMFLIEIPTVFEVVEGNTLSLIVGGVKSFSLDSLYGKKGNDEHFKIFIGFKNSVCTNLCVWSDGLINDVKVSSIGQLQGSIKTLIEKYNAAYHLKNLHDLHKYSLTEKQFAQIIGRCRLYQSLPYQLKKNVPALLFGDYQVNAVCRDYYKDESFCRDDEGNINLWKLYNLFTSVNKSSYIDNFLEKSVNAYLFVEQIKFALQNQNSNWFLN